MQINRLYDKVNYYTDMTDVGPILDALGKADGWDLRFGTKFEDGSWDVENSGSSLVESKHADAIGYAQLIEKHVLECIESYCDEYGLEFNPNNLIGQETIDKHYPGTALMSHTDSLPPLCKEGYTVLLYLNNNYEGGEVSFSIKDVYQEDVGIIDIGVDHFSHPSNSSDSIDFWLVPDAFSILIFPPKTPYFHTAHLITGGHKYLIKAFYIAAE